MSRRCDWGGRGYPSSCCGCLGRGSACIFGNIQCPRGLHTGFWAKGRRRGQQPVENERSSGRWGCEIGTFGAVSRARSCACGPRMLNIPEFARRPRGYLRAKSDRPAEICNRRGGLCKRAAAGALAARQGPNHRTGHSALLRAPSDQPKRERFVLAGFIWPNVGQPMDCPAFCSCSPMGAHVAQRSYWPMQRRA